jgi:hypothetical protein
VFEIRDANGYVATAAAAIRPPEPTADRDVQAERGFHAFRHPKHRPAIGHKADLVKILMASLNDERKSELPSAGLSELDISPREIIVKLLWWEAVPKNKLTDVSIGQVAKNPEVRHFIFLLSLVLPDS